MKRMLAKSIGTGIVAAAVLGFTTLTSAVPTLTVNDGVDPVVTVADGSGLDGNAAAGAVVYSGSMGNWSLIVNVGQTKPFLGSAAAPQLDLGYVVTSTGAGTITITWSDTGFTSTAGFTAQIGGTSAGSVTFKTYADTGNALFGIGTPLTTQSFSSSPFSGTANAGPVGGALYSLTEQIIVTHGAGNLSESGNAALATVPDGGATVTLLGTSLAFLGLMGSFCKRS